MIRKLRVREERGKAGETGGGTVNRGYTQRIVCSFLKMQRIGRVQVVGGGNLRSPEKVGREWGASG